MTSFKDPHYMDEMIGLTFSDVNEIIRFTIVLSFIEDTKNIFLFKAREIYELDEDFVGELSKVLIKNEFATPLEACELIENFRSK
jgi:hypothetical protein